MQLHQSHLSLDGGVCVLHQHLNILGEPLTSTGCALVAALTIALATGLDPDNAVDLGVVDGGAGLNTKAGGRDVAPLTPLLTGTGIGDTALIDDKARGQTIRLKVWGQRIGVVRLVPGVGVLGVGLTDLSLEGVVVGDVGREATDFGAVAT